MIPLGKVCRTRHFVKEITPHWSKNLYLYSVTTVLLLPEQSVLPTHWYNNRHLISYREEEECKNR